MRSVGLLRLGGGMTRSLVLIICATFALLAGSGCSTVDSRIREHESMFRGLDPSTQQKLREKKVEIGYTPDMVYIALGRPSSRSERVTANAQTMIWIYTISRTEHAGRVVRERRTVVVDPRTGRRALIIQPVVTDVYEETEEEAIRIEFKDGLVSAIEMGEN